MATKVTEVVVDDIDGSVAVETVAFTIGGTTYEADLSAKNVAKLDRLLTPYKARRSGGRGRGRKGSTARRGAGRSSGSKAKTLFSTLEDDAKDAFRKWAELPTARRIADHRVQAWLDAGRPAQGRGGVKKAVTKKAARKAPAKRAAKKA